MLFPQKTRFKERKGSKTVGYVAPRSELSHHGIKIIDSWVPRENGERLPQNLALRNGFLIPIENQSPSDIYQYTPHYEAIYPKPISTKFSDSPRFPERVSESLSPSPIKLKGDFDRELKPVKGFGSAPRKLKFPTPTPVESGITHERDSPIQEEPSFVSLSSLYNMDGEGSWLSIESADRSYAATSERSCGFKIGERFRNSLPNPPGPGPGTLNLRDSEPFLGRTPAITLKSRVHYDPNKEKKIIPGPGAYYNPPSLVSPSFNILAKTSIDHREDLIEKQPLNKSLIVNHQPTPPSQQISERSSFSRPSLPSRPSSHPKQQSHRHRLLFDMQSLEERNTNTNKSNQGSTIRDNSFIPGGAYHVPHIPVATSSPSSSTTTTTSTTTGVVSGTASTTPRTTQNNNQLVKRDSTTKPVESASSSPSIHLTKDDVKNARKLFRSILQSTEDILSN